MVALLVVAEAAVLVLDPGLGAERTGPVSWLVFDCWPPESNVKASSVEKIENLQQIRKDKYILEDKSHPSYHIVMVESKSFITKLV
jgi:hypothetical protein